MDKGTTSYMAGSEEKVSRKKGYTPADGDWQLTRVSFDEAENGIVVECSYTLSEEAKGKQAKSRDAGLACPSEWREPLKHVFQTKAEAKAFIVAELDKIWQGD